MCRHPKLGMTLNRHWASSCQCRHYPANVADIPLAVNAVFPGQGVGRAGGLRVMPELVIPAASDAPVSVDGKGVCA